MDQTVTVLETVTLFTGLLLWFVVKRWLLRSSRGGTGWLALEPTGVPWHKRYAVINLSVS